MRIATSSSPVGSYNGISAFVQDYNENFSYRIPSHIQMNDSSDEDEQFIFYRRVDVRIVTIDSESDSN